MLLDPSQKSTVGLPMCSGIGAANLIFNPHTDFRRMKTVVRLMSEFYPEYLVFLDGDKSFGPRRNSKTELADQWEFSWIMYQHLSNKKDNIL